MADARRRKARAKRTEPDKTGHGGAEGLAPFGAVWRDERDLSVRRDGSLDEAVLKRWYRARKAGQVWARKGEHGMIQLACDPAEPSRPLRVGEAVVAGTQQAAPDLERRHLELESRLRECPYLGDDTGGLPQVRFALTRAEIRELIDLRKIRGCGEDLGDGEVRTYWRPDCEDNIVGRGRLFLPRYELKGRARK